ncbi:MAG: ECF-type riboflavin transporter substrate-binding protein [Eubacteriales bacterium]
MNKLSIKTVVAIGIGSALFFVVGRFAAIPTGVPNTNLTIQYALLALFAMLYGPIAGGLIGLIGHTLIDLSWGGSPWWSWILASAVVGVLIGFLTKNIDMEVGVFGKKEIITYGIACLAGNALAWLVVAPGLDILIYAEPASKLLAQSVTATIINFVASAVVGGILAVAYAKTRTKKGSLTVD